MYPLEAGAARPNTLRPTGLPAGYNPNAPRGPDSSLAQNFQNMQLNQPLYAPTPPSSRPPPSFGQNLQFPPSTTHHPQSTFGGPSPAYRPEPPPPGAIPRGVMPPGGPPPNIVPPNVASGGHPPFASRPAPPGSQPSSNRVNLPPGTTTFHGSQPVPQQSSARPSGFGSPPLTTGPAPPMSAQPRPLSNGPPANSYGGFPGGPPSAQQPPNFGRPPTMGPFGSSAQPPMHAQIGGQATVGPGSPVTRGPSQPPSPFSAGSQRGPPSFAQPWQTQPRQGAPMTGNSQPPPVMYGMPLPLGSQNMPAAVGPPDFNQTGGQVGSKVDTSQIPRLISDSSVLLY